MPVHHLAHFLKEFSIDPLLVVNQTSESMMPMQNCLSDTKNKRCHQNCFPATIPPGRVRLGFAPPAGSRNRAGNSPVKFGHRRGIMTGKDFYIPDGVVPR